MASFASQLLLADLNQRASLAAAEAVQRNGAVLARLSENDKRRAEAIAYAVAERLLDVPASSLQQWGSTQSDDSTVDVLRELFGLDQRSAGWISTALSEARAQD